MRNGERDKMRELVERDERTREREEKYMRKRERGTQLYQENYCLHLERER